MALFPSCSFDLAVPNGMLQSGESVQAELTLDVKERIERATAVVVKVRSVAKATYGDGNHKRTLEETMFESVVRIPLPHDQALARGRHRFPFTIDLPAWLPRGFDAGSCSIFHEIETRLDVDWALDPSETITPDVRMKPLAATRNPVTARSPEKFHDAIVVEVALDSSVVAENESVRGRIALRGGLDAPLRMLHVSLFSIYRIIMGQSDARHVKMSTLEIPADDLRSGAPVPFVLPPRGIRPGFHTKFIAHEPVLTVKAVIPFALDDPEFAVDLVIVPQGSSFTGAAQPLPVGTDWLRRLGKIVAERSGLREGSPPCLVEGAAGAVQVFVRDAPRGGQLGIDVCFVFPSVELGTDWGERGVLDVFTPSSTELVPETLRSKFALKVDPSAPGIAIEAIGPWIDALVGDVPPSTAIALSDTSLVVHHKFTREEEQRVVDLARGAKAKAEVIAKAIASLPFPPALSDSQETWASFASSEGATLVPTAPSIDGLSFRLVTTGGEARTFEVNIHTRHRSGAVTTEVALRFAGAPVPPTARASLAEPSPRAPHSLKGAREVFAQLLLDESMDGATLVRAGFTPDPRLLMPAIEMFVSWLLEVRGERRVDAPYR